MIEFINKKRTVIRVEDHELSRIKILDESNRWHRVRPTKETPALVPQAEDDLDGLTKKQLLAVAEKMKIEVKGQPNIAALTSLIREARKNSEEAPDEPPIE